MTQLVSVDGRNNVRVVEAGPPGPPGFFGSGDGPSGPVELLPLTISRLVPFMGWSQMGVPPNTMAWHGYRVGLSFASLPLYAATLETMQQAPLYMAVEAETLNFSVSAFGIDFAENLFPLDARIRVTGLIGSTTGSEEPSDRILGEAQLASPRFEGPPGPAGPLEAMIEDFTNVFTFDLEASEGIMALRIDVLTAEGETFDPLSLTMALATMRTSLWKGSPTARAHIDPYATSTYLGQMFTNQIGTVYSMGFAQRTLLFVNSQGLMGTAFRLDPEGPTSDGLEAPFFMEPNDESDPTYVRWRTNRLAVDEAPVEGTDVLRLMDAPDFTPYGLRLMTPSVPRVPIGDGDTVAAGDGVIYNIVLTEALGETSFYFSNPPVGMVATPKIIITNTSSGLATVSAHGPGPVDVSQVVAPGDVWLATAVVEHSSEAYGLLTIDFMLLVQSTPPALVEVPKTVLRASGLDGDGKIPIDHSRIELGVADGSNLSFVNPGLGRYAIFELDYTSGSSGEAFPINNANHYYGGSWADPLLLTPDTLYLWRVMVVGTESGDPDSDFMQLESP